MDLRLLGCFRLSANGRPIEVPPASARVLAYLGVHGKEVERATMAQVLWPDADRTRSLGNLRSALWRLPTCSRDAVRERGARVGLHPAVACDVDAVVDRVAARRTVPFGEAMTWGWRDELLPGWYDDWVLLERERLSIRRAAVLEHLSSVCRRSGLVGDAVLYAALAVELQPLRESAHQALLEAHVSQGNLVEAHAHFDTLTALLRNELGVAPSTQTEAIIHRSRLRDGTERGADR